MADAPKPTTPPSGTLPPPRRLTREEWNQKRNESGPRKSLGDLMRDGKIAPPNESLDERLRRDSAAGRKQEEQEPDKELLAMLKGDDEEEPEEEQEPSSDDELDLGGGVKVKRGELAGIVQAFRNGEAFTAANTRRAQQLADEKARLELEQRKEEEQMKLPEETVAKLKEIGLDGLVSKLSADAISLRNQNKQIAAALIQVTTGAEIRDLSSETGVRPSREEQNAIAKLISVDIEPGLAFRTVMSEKIARAEKTNRRGVGGDESAGHIPGRGRSKPRLKPGVRNLMKYLPPGVNTASFLKRQQARARKASQQG